MFDASLVRPALWAACHQAEPARAVAQPGDVRRLHRQHPDHAAVAACPRLRGRQRHAAGLRARDRGLALVHRAVRQLRRGAGRGPQQGPGRLAARPAQGHLGQEADRSRTTAPAFAARAGQPTCARATWCWSRPATWSRSTARSSRAWPRSTRAPSPANRRRWCASRAATSRPSPAARGCCRTGWWCASRSIRASPSSTA